MRILGDLPKKVRRLTHGGCEVLRIETVLPTAKTAAAAHLGALMAALEAYAEGELLPAAVNELTLLAEGGRGYAFCRQCYRALAKERAVRGGVLVTLCVTHVRVTREGEELLFLKELPMLWDGSGSFQRRIGKRLREKG